MQSWLLGPSPGESWNGASYMLFTALFSGVLNNQSQSLEVRLHRALEEVSKQKEAVRQTRGQHKDLGQGQRLEMARLEGHCQRLERQKVLIACFKCLIHGIGTWHGGGTLLVYVVSVVDGTVVGVRRYHRDNRLEE